MRYITGRYINYHRTFSPLQPITLLLESVPAKDLSCLIAGYCKVFIDPQICVFPWTDESKSHRISAEEGEKTVIKKIIEKQHLII